MILSFKISLTVLSMSAILIVLFMAQRSKVRGLELWLPVWKVLDTWTSVNVVLPAPPTGWSGQVDGWDLSHSAVFLPRPVRGLHRQVWQDGAGRDHKVCNASGHLLPPPPVWVAGRCCDRSVSSVSARLQLRNFYIMGIFLMSKWVTAQPVIWKEYSKKQPRQWEAR